MYVCVPVCACTFVCLICDFYCFKTFTHFVLGNLVIAFVYAFFLKRDIEKSVVLNG